MKSLAASLFSFATLFVLTASSAHAAGNLLTNGNFEAGNAGFSSSYTYSPGNLWGEDTFDVVSDPHIDHSLATSYGDHTTGSGLMLAVNGSGSASDVVWSETVSVTPGDTYDFSGFLSSWSQGYGPIADLQFTINGMDIGQADAPVTAGVWNSFGNGWNAGAAHSATIAIYDLETAAGGNDFSLDDLSFTAADNVLADATAPTPGPLMGGLVGFALVAAWKLRTRAAVEPLFVRK